MWSRKRNHNPPLYLFTHRSIKCWGIYNWPRLHSGLTLPIIASSARATGLGGHPWGSPGRAQQRSTASPRGAPQGPGRPHSAAPQPGSPGPAPQPGCGHRVTATTGSPPPVPGPSAPPVPLSPGEGAAAARPSPPLPRQRLAAQLQGALRTRGRSRPAAAWGKGREGGGAAPVSPVRVRSEVPQCVYSHFYSRYLFSVQLWESRKIGTNVFSRRLKQLYPVTALLTESSTAAAQASLKIILTSLFSFLICNLIDLQNSRKHSLLTEKKAS